MKLNGVMWMLFSMNLLGADVALSGFDGHCANVWTARSPVQETGTVFEKARERHSRE